MCDAQEGAARFQCEQAANAERDERRGHASRRPGPVQPDCEKRRVHRNDVNQIGRLFLAVDERHDEKVEKRENEQRAIVSVAANRGREKRADNSQRVSDENQALEIDQTAVSVRARPDRRA
jgi:hypothetical protein